MMQEEDERSPLIRDGSTSPLSRASLTNSYADGFLGDARFSSFECKVCGQRGSVPANHSGRVAKCESCGEGTPIRLPAPGKQYVRCVCHCLLVCQVGVNYLRCPRMSCRRVVEVRPHTPAQIEVNERFAVSSGEAQPQHMLKCVVCGQFYERGQYAMSGLCSYCSKAHTREEDRLRNRCVGLLALSVICCLALGGVLYTTRVFESEHPAFLALWIGLGALGVGLLVCGLRYAQKINALSWPGSDT